MVTDDERKFVAAVLRAYDGSGATADTIGEITALIIGAGDDEGWTWEQVYARLADLIEPAPTSSDRGPTPDPTERGIDSIYDWCFERIEGADGAEDYLYCSIMSAIEEYRHPGRVTARTARPVDRRALLRLADKVFEDTEGDMSTRGKLMPAFIAGQCLRDVASRIRVLCGEEDS